MDKKKRIRNVSTLFQSILIHNLVFLSCFIWSIALPQNEESIFICLAINILSIFLDIIILAVHYPSWSNSHTAEFSAVMAVFNLLLRLASSHVLYQEWSDRKGVVGVSVIKASHAEGGSVRSGSVLTHYPGQIILFLSKAIKTVYSVAGHFDGKVQESPSQLPPLPPSYSVNN